MTLTNHTRIVSISTALFDGYPMELAVEEIAAAGYRFVEPAFIKGYVDFDETAFSPQEVVRLRNLVEARGLGIHALSAHLDLSQPDSAEALKRRAGFAADLGAAVLITNSGPVEKRDAIRAAIEAVLPDLEHAGLVLALENPGHGYGDLTGTVAQAARFIRAIGSSHVKMNHDAGNAFTYSHAHSQPAEDIADAPDIVAHAHLKDIQSVGDDWLFCALGQGDVGYPAYWKTIPHDLSVSIELPLRLERRGRMDPVRRAERLSLEALRRDLTVSIDYLRQLESTVL